MNIKSKYIKPKFKKETNPKIGLLALSTDLTIENDFQSICQDLPIDIFSVNVPAAIRTVSPLAAIFTAY